MLLGVAVISRSGIPLLLREILPGFFNKLRLLEIVGKRKEISKKGTLVSSLITAIIDFADEVFKKDMGSITIGEMEITLYKSKDYIVAIFSEKSYLEAPKLAKEIAKVIDELDLEPALLELYPDEREKFLKVIEEKIFEKFKSLCKFSYKLKNLPVPSQRRAKPAQGLSLIHI